MSVRRPTERDRSVARKRKSAEPVRTAVVSARQPSQERGRRRFGALLDATAALLGEKDFNDIGLYDIAERAKVPPASVYHFLPTKEAAFIALAQRYLAEFREALDRPVEAARIQNWPDLVNLRFDRAVEFINKKPAFGKLFLGGSVMSEIRRLDVEYVASTSSVSYQWLDQYFVMPYLSNHELKFSVLIAIYDGVWMTSYARHGSITEQFKNEARGAAMAYCRTFLPDVIPRRPPPAPAVDDASA
jgi:AcrR family transcriptional regulator